MRLLLHLILIGCRVGARRFGKSFRIPSAPGPRTTLSKDGAVCLQHLQTKQAVDIYNRQKKPVLRNRIKKTRAEADEEHKKSNKIATDIKLHVFCLMCEPRYDDPEFEKLEADLQKLCNVEDQANLWAACMEGSGAVDEGFGCCVAWPDSS